MPLIGSGNQIHVLAANIVLQGRVTSFYGPELQKYTSIRAHPENEGPVKQFLFHERGVISVAPRSVHLSSRRGLPQWHIACGYHFLAINCDLY